MSEKELKPVGRGSTFWEDGALDDKKFSMFKNLFTHLKSYQNCGVVALINT